MHSEGEVARAPELAASGLNRGAISRELGIPRSTVSGWLNGQLPTIGPYLFSNRSADIRGIFCDACERLDIEWRQNNPFCISVARRNSVALMDRFIGPKR